MTTKVKKFASETSLELKKGMPYPFGATEKNNGINFAIYAPKTEMISICFFEEGHLTQPYKEIELNSSAHRTGNVWHIWIKGLPSPIIYAYRLSPHENEDLSYLLLDPYAKAIASDPTWHSEIKQNKYHPRGKVIKDNGFEWENDVPPNIPRNDLIIYEMHVRGFTQHSSSKVQYPGTFKGLIEKIPYLKDLGINAIELLPIHEFNECEAIHKNPETKKKLHNYFGYSTVNFFSPMNRYASSNAANEAIDEFKTMVKELHKNGIEIILDVVFNHTAEGNEKGPMISFKGFDSIAYYMTNEHGHYLNYSGCGNTFNTNHPLVREFIIAALRYWVVEMHVDGFRFDLASIFTRTENGALLDNAPILEAITKDPILTNVKLIAEAWDAGGLYQLGDFAAKSPHWSEWNGKFRDMVRNYIKGSSNKNNFAGVLSGSQEVYGSTGSPSCSINFVTCHDGFSLMDLVSYNEKHNFVNGEDNRDGLNNNDSWNCGTEGPTTDEHILKLRQKQMRNFHLALMVSQGIPMLLMGDEYGHTRKGNNNAWCQDNELNWFLWDKLNENSDFYRYYHSLIYFRKNHPLLGRDTFFAEKDVIWHGINPNNAEWENDNRFIAFTLHFPNGDPGVYIAFNSSHFDLEAKIPSPGENKTWQWVVNTQNDSPDDFYMENQKKLDSDQIKIGAYSAIMLKI